MNKPNIKDEKLEISAGNVTIKEILIYRMDMIN